MGQYETLFQELERESRGDYVGYIRVDPTLFAELPHRVTPRITKGPRCVCLHDLDIFFFLQASLAISIESFLLLI